MRAIHLSVDHNCTLYSYNNTFTLWNQDRDTGHRQVDLHVFVQSSVNNDFCYCLDYHFIGNSVAGDAESSVNHL